MNSNFPYIINGGALAITSPTLPDINQPYLILSLFIPYRRICWHIHVVNNYLGPWFAREKTPHSSLYRETKYVLNWCTTQLKAIQWHSTSLSLEIYISLRCAQTFNIWSNQHDINLFQSRLQTTTLRMTRAMQKEWNMRGVISIACRWCLRGCLDLKVLWCIRLTQLGNRGAAISGQLRLWSPTTARHSSSLPSLWCHRVFQQHRTPLEPRHAHGCVSTTAGRLLSVDSTRLTERLVRKFNI